MIIGFLVFTERYGSRDIISSNTTESIAIDEYGSSDIISSDTAESIAEDYFSKEYGLDVEFIDIYRLQVGEHNYRNSLNVEYNDDEYCVYLNKNNQPYFDDYRETIRKKELEAMDFKSALGTHGIIANEANFHIGVSYDDQKSLLTLECRTDKLLPAYTFSMYNFINELNTLGIDRFSISCQVPDFMQPKPELGYGMYSVLLGSYSFNTQVNEHEFEKAYCEFKESVFYDELKFNSIVLEMERIGYQNVCFMIPSQTNSNVLEIVLYCEAGDDTSTEQAQNIIDSIDETYFRCQGREIKYLLNYNNASTQGTSTQGTVLCVDHR